MLNFFNHLGPLGSVESLTAVGLVAVRLVKKLQGCNFLDTKKPYHF